MAVKAKVAARYIDENTDLITEVADKLWEVAEVALREFESAEYLAEKLEVEGFEVERGVGGLPTAFLASWGNGKPVVGFLGEYDALAGMSQKPVPYREPVVPGGAGQACGHNLLGAGAFGAAIALKRQMEAENIDGTVRFYGCPAEENLSGKAFMARDGVFDDCDICLTWHPGALNRVRNTSSLANNAVNVTFLGQAAHAAGDPENGRSALDAVQLMNIGVEFLREHMPQQARVHYVITEGGGQPNVVPDRAKVWYLVRAPQRHEVDDLYDRVLNCAGGAAQMTGTEYELELLKAIWNVLPNAPLEDLLEECMNRVGPPQFDEEERDFARQIISTFPEGRVESFLEGQYLTEEQIEELKDRELNDTILSRSPVRGEPKGSTDVGDVSWCAPTAQFTTACNALGTPGHSWQYAAQAGMGIGHKGALLAARVLAEAGYEAMTDSAWIPKAREDFERRTGGRSYRSAMPPDHQPAFDQFTEK
ncbi:MAG: amidohydrolase [Clostridia bacterium]